MKRLSPYIWMALVVAGLVLSACGGGATPVATQAPAAATQAVTAAPAVKVRVATDATWPPFEIVNESTKQIEGFDIDLFRGIAQKANLDVEFINVAFDPLLAGIGTCQYDAAISAMTITDDRKKSMLFSDPYFEAGQVVSVQAANTAVKSKDDLSGKKVGAQIGTTGAIEAAKINGAVVKTYDDVGLAFQDLINGQIDAVIADNPLALGYVGKNPAKIKTVGTVFTEEMYGIAICKDKTDLQAKINQGLAAVKSAGLIDELTKKWITVGK
ncbi:MAG TPA: basic amino acid ABC transporter substrate-binding protein [Anaerolineales bacterium]